MSASANDNRGITARWLAKARAPLSYLCTAMLLWSCVLASYSVAVAAPVNLDLGSTSPSVAPGTVTSPVVISVGGRPQVVTTQSSLTPAQYVAATQVMQTGRQTLLLSTAGAAVGGYANTTTFAGNLAALTVPSGVSITHDFATGVLNLSGNLVNSGRIYAVSTDNGVSLASITAENISNLTGGLLTTVLPIGSPVLSGFGYLRPFLSLSLNANNNVLNQGVISSSGSLTVTAGHSIINGNSANAGTSGAATMLALGSVTLSAPEVSNQGDITSLLSNININANRLMNSGIISANQSSINISPLAGTTLDVRNTNGLMTSRSGINFSLADTGANTMNILGGRLVSSSARFDANGTGSVTVSLVDLPENVWFNARTINLTVSNGSNGLNASGLEDATSGSLNYSGAGDVTFDSFRSNGGNVAINTSGSINVGNIVTSSNGSNSGNAGNITLIAGHDIDTHTLNASGTGNNGHSGDIVIQAGGPNGTDGVANVQNIITPGGSLSMGLDNTNVQGHVNIGDGSIHWEIPDNGLYVVDFSKLIQYGGSSVTVGGSDFHSDIVVNHDCDGCLGSGSLSIMTQGTYSATGTTMTLAEGQNFSVTAEGGINTGSVNANGVAFATNGLLTVDGDLNGKSTVSLLGGDISIAANTTTSSHGGDVWMIAANDITIGAGTTIASYASADGTSGGQIGVMAGQANFDMAAQLAGMQSARNGQELLALPTNGGWGSGNVINSTGGSNMVVSFPRGADKTITNSTFTLNGGVLFIDPPGTNNVNIDGANFVVVGPAVLPTPGGSTGGGSTSPTGGTTGGTTVPVVSNGSSARVLTGGITFGSFVSSTAISTDLTTNTNSNTNTVTLQGVDLSSPQNADANQRDRHEPLRAAIYCAPPGKLKENESLDTDNWIIASNKCQPFSFEASDGSIIVGTGPAIFAPTANRTLLLKEGKLLIIAGDGMIVVRTPMSNVTVPQNSAATIEFSQSGVTRVTGLAGGKASVSVTRQGETIILTAAPGEQLVLAEDTVSESEIVCMPDVPNKKNESWLVRLAGVRGQKFSFDRMEMVSREGLLNCTLGCFTKIQQSMIDQIRKSMMMVSPPKELKSMLPPAQRRLIAKARVNDHLQAVSLGQVLDLTVPDLVALKSASALIRYTKGANISIISPNQLELRNGNVLISTQAVTTVAAGKHTIKLEPHTVALINMRHDHVVVRNIYGSAPGSVKLVTAERKVVGSIVGQEMILSHARASLSSILSEEPVARRRMRHVEVAEKTGLTMCEVSLVSLIQNTDILSQMARSEHPEDKAILGRIMKMAVALQFATAKHGNYAMMGN